MSHIDQGPLPAYNSLADQHLAGYFTNTRMRRHLRKAGLVNKYGEIVTENTYRLNMSRREHKQHVKDMLAQAIVHKTLDLERTRQAEIRRKLEEIAKIELVRRVRASRYRKREVDILPYISPRSSASRPSSGPDTDQGARRPGHGARQGRIPGSATGSRSSRPISDPPRNRKRRPMSALSSNYDDDEEGAVVYLDDEGRPITPAHVDEANLRYASKDPIDTRHLYSLDTAALRKYATLMAKMEQGRGGASPYLIPQVPIPPKSPKSSRGASARRTPRSAQRYRGEQSKSSSPKRPSTANQAYLHPAFGGQKFKGQQESLLQVSMVYHGSSLSLAREMLPGRSKQDIVVEQQHCGGNTLTVFRDRLEKGSKFSFISYRHRGYPFSLSIYIDGKMDCRVSTCCEYRHQKGGRIGGKKGHFSISGIQGAVPCYKCQVEKGIRVGNQAPRPKLKRPPEVQEEVVVVETAREPEQAKSAPEPAALAPQKEQILVPVEDGDDQKADDQYDDDEFESSASDSQSSSGEDEGGLVNFQPKDARGVERITGKVDINDLTSDEESDTETPRQLAPAAKQKAGSKGRHSRARPAGSRSYSPSASSDSESEQTARGVAQTQVVVLGSQQPQRVKSAALVTRSSPPDAGKSNTRNPSPPGVKGGNEEKPDLSITKAETAAESGTKVDTELEMGPAQEEQPDPAIGQTLIDEQAKEDQDGKKEEAGRKRSDSSSSSSSSSSSRSEEGSTKDYSDTDKAMDNLKPNKEEEESKREEEAQEVQVSVQVEDGQKKEKDEAEADEKEGADIDVKGEVAGGVEDQELEMMRASSGAENTTTVVTVVDIRNEEEQGENEQEVAPARITSTEEDVTSPSTQQEKAEETPEKRPISATSTRSSSSAVSSSSSSGSAVLSDKGPNTANDPTVTSAPNEPERKSNEPETPVVEQVTVVTSSPPKAQPSLSNKEGDEEAAPPEQGKDKQESGSEDSDSDSSSSQSDNEQKENDKVQVKNDQQENTEQADVLALLASKVAEEQKEEEERNSARKEKEETEIQKKKEEEEMKEAKKDEEEQEKKTEVLPSVTVSQHTSGSSSGSSSGDSNSSDDESDGEKMKQSKVSVKTGVIQTEADVHNSDGKHTGKIETADSDPDAMHGGNDPDKVAESADGSLPEPVPPAASLPKVSPGSIQPLLEKSRCMVEIKGVTLNKSQLYECAKHITAHSQLNQLNLVNCGLDDDDLQKVTEALKLSSSNPVLLNLSLNPLSSACVDYLLDLLESKPSIEALLLQGTRLGDAGVERLVNGLLTQHRDKGKRPNSKELQELDLSDCKMGDDGAKAVARLLSSDMEVDTLTLSSNQAVSEHGWAAIGEALSRNTTLETLTLDHNLLGDPGIKAIASGLQDNTCVTALDLNGVGITQVGGRTLLELLKRNTTLLEITLVGNTRLDSATLENIGKYIALNKTMGGGQSTSQ